MSINSSFPIGHAAISAGVNKLITQASVSLINNQGDFGAVLKELGSSASLRSLATAIVTAGLTQGITPEITKGLNLPVVEGDALSIQALSNKFTNQLVKNSIDATITAGVSTAINGGDFDDAIKANLLSAVTDSALSVTQAAIGSVGKEYNLSEGSIEKALLHAGAGAIAAKLNGGDPLAGAAAAAVAELTSTMFNGASDEQQIEAAKLIGGLVGLLVSDGDANDISIAAQIAGSAQTYNRQLHREEAELIRSNAAAYAVLRGWCVSKAQCNENALFRALAELMAQALKQVDSSFAKKVSENKEASSFLSNLAKENVKIASKDGFPASQNLFDERGRDNFYNHVLNSEQISQNRDLYDSLEFESSHPAATPIKGTTYAYVTAALDKANLDKAEKHIVGALFQSMEDEWKRAYPGKEFKELDENFLRPFLSNPADGVIAINGKADDKTHDILYALANGLRNVAHSHPDTV